METERGSEALEYLTGQGRYEQQKVKPGSYQATGTVFEKLCDFWLENNIRIDDK